MCACAVKLYIAMCRCIILHFKTCEQFPQSTENSSTQWEGEPQSGLSHPPSTSV